MESIRLIEGICNEFLQGSIGLEDLQRKLNLLAFEGELSKQLYDVISTADNSIEEILFGCFESSFYQRGVEVVMHIKDEISTLCV